MGVIPLNTNSTQPESNPVVPKKRTYVDVKAKASRGILAPKDFVDASREVLLFQYNPTEIQDSKGTEWVAKSYVGFSSQDYMWVKGNERVLSFKLFMDATASSIPIGSNNSVETFYPRGVMEMVEKLTKYLYPIQDDRNSPVYSSGGIVPNTRFMPPPLAIFVFGDLYLEGIVADVAVSYQLFNKDLQPIRCECQVKFKVIESMVVTKDQRLNKTYL